MKKIKSILRRVKQKLKPQRTRTEKKPEVVITRDAIHEWEKLSEKEFSLFTKACIDNNTIDDLVSKMISVRDSFNKDYLKRFSQVRRTIKRESNDQKYRDTLAKLFYAHTLEDYSYEQFQEVFLLKLPIFQAASFKINLIRRARMRQIGRVPERWLTYSKEAAYHFSDMLDVQRPKTTFHVRFKDIEPTAGIVIKPCIGRGARGVYLVIDSDNILSLTKGTRLNSWQEMEEHIAHELKSGIIDKDDFIVQECIYDDPIAKTPPRDLKFHMFYGEVGAVFEVSRYPEKKDWWWSADGKLLETGWHWFGKKETDPKYEKLKGFGFTKEQMEIAKNISLQIPCPYIRIDFLKSGEEIFFAEFCSIQGNIGSLNQRTDRLFGNMYLKAEMRIIDDMNNGKRFDQIKVFNEEWEYKLKGHGVSRILYKVKNS